MKPWKSSSRTPESATHCVLQWGHGDEAVEEQQPHAGVGDPLALQWGHGDEAVEERPLGAHGAELPTASMGPRR